MPLNARQVNDIAGIDPTVTAAQYTAAANDPARVQLLIDAYAPDATQVNRGHMDMIAPPAKIQLLKDLTILFAAVT